VERLTEAQSPKFKIQKPKLKLFDELRISEFIIKATMLI